MDGAGGFRVAALSDARRRELAQERLFEELQEQGLSLKELELARDIQRHLLPPAHVAREGFSVAARSFPARFVAGDFYGVLSHPQGDDAVHRRAELGRGHALGAQPPAGERARSRAVRRVGVRALSAKLGACTGFRTDGIPEARLPGRETLGYEALTAAVAEVEHGPAAAEVWLDQVLDRIQSITGPILDDDYTAVVLEAGVLARREGS